MSHFTTQWCTSRAPLPAVNDLTTRAGRRNWPALAPAVVCYGANASADGLENGLRTVCRPCPVGCSEGQWTRLPQLQEERVSLDLVGDALHDLGGDADGVGGAEGAPICSPRNIRSV